MVEKRCNRAQITLFLIIGIFVLFIFGFLMFVVSSTTVTKKPGLEQQVSQLIAYCIKKTIIESYSIPGIDADRIKADIDSKLLECADLSLFEEDAEISHGGVNSNIRVSNTTIFTDVELPIVIKKGGYIVNLESFNYILPRLYTETLPLDNEGRLTRDFIIRSSDDMLELYLQKGTLAMTNDNQPLRAITIYTLSITQSDPTLGYYTVYDLRPHGAYFQPKAKLSIKYLPGSASYSSYVVKREIDSGLWRIMDSTVDSASQTVETEIDGFSEVGRGYSTPPSPVCGNKKGIVLHLRDTLMDPAYWPLYIEEAKAITGAGGWVLEDVAVGVSPGDVKAFIQAVKDAGLRPIIRLTPESGSYDAKSFAKFAYQIGQGLNPSGYFVQVCNEPNHQGWPCQMDPQTYAQQMIKFTKELHRLDKDRKIKVVSAGLDPTQDAAGYAKVLFDYTGSDGLTFHDAIDAWATHAYDAAQWQAEMDIVGKEELPVFVTEGGYPPSDGQLDKLCPKEAVTKLLYNCINPLDGGDTSGIEDRAKKITITKGECEGNKWDFCDCEEKWPKQDCDDDDSADDCCYEDKEDNECCQKCSLWCLIDKREDGWNDIRDWKSAHQEFASYITGKLNTWGQDERVVGVTPFMLFDGKEITGDILKRGGIDLKFDYQCQKKDIDNWRPRYWEYVLYKGDFGGTPQRACDGVSDPQMPDPYRYPVMTAVAGLSISNDECPFATSGPDINDTGESEIPPEADSISTSCTNPPVELTLSYEGDRYVISAGIGGCDGGRIGHVYCALTGPNGEKIDGHENYCDEINPVVGSTTHSSGTLPGPGTYTATVFSVNTECGWQAGSKCTTGPLQYT